MNDTCETCKFSENPDEKFGGYSGVLVCLRYPPIVPRPGSNQVHPHVLKRDWCGEYVKR